MILATHVSCGGIIPRMALIIPKLTATIVDLLKIGVPVILVILGMLDFGKAVMAQKEDEIKKNQQLFVKRLIAAVLVYLVFIVVEFLFNFIAPETEDNSNGIWDCVNCFINGPGDGTKNGCKALTK